MNISNSILTQYNSANLSYLDKSKSVNQTASTSDNSTVKPSTGIGVSKVERADHDGMSDGMRTVLERAYADPGYASRSVDQSLKCPITYCGPHPTNDAERAQWKVNEAIFNSEVEKHFNEKRVLHQEMKANGFSDADIYKELIMVDKKSYDFNRKLNGHI